MQNSEMVIVLNNGSNNDIFAFNIVSSVGIEEKTTNKELIKVTDLMGRETKQTNQPLLYIYDDGTVEKRITID